MIAPDRVRALLETAFPGAEIVVTDTTGTEDHYEATVVAPQFAGKSRIEQHQMVYRALGEAMRGSIHALALTTRSK